MAYIAFVKLSGTAPTAEYSFLCVGFVPEAGDHLGEADDLLDAVGHQVSQVGKHRQLCVLLVGVGTAGAVLVHHQHAAEVHLGVHGLCLRRR